MEGHRDIGKRAGLISVGAAILMACLPSPAWAEASRGDRIGPSTGADVHTEADSVSLRLHHEADGSVSARSSRPSTCSWHAERYEGTAPYGASDIPVAASAQPSPAHQLYLVWCGDYSVFRWFGPADFDDAQPLAEELIRRLTVGDSAIQVRPESRGITGIPSYFWIEGYGDQPIEGTESAFGLTVRVTIRLVGVSWDFGDDTPIVQAGLGEAWPERSSVAHSYRYSSSEPYTVTATLRFQPSYTVNGAAGAPLDPITIPVSRPYLVHQIQAERTR
jgi:hypothetical protein